MGCCGQKRAEISRTAATSLATNWGVNRASPAVQPPMGDPQGPRTSGSSTEHAAPSAWGTVLLRYSETSAVRVVGPVTGRNYAFSAAVPVQAVAPQDVEALLATRFFRRV
jgi:hypothetical protein